MLDENNLLSLGEFPPGAVPADEPSESAEAWQDLSSDLTDDVLEKLDFLEANISVAEDFQNPIDNFEVARQVGSHAAHSQKIISKTRSISTGKLFPNLCRRHCCRFPFWTPRCCPIL